MSSFSPVLALVTLLIALTAFLPTLSAQPPPPPPPFRRPDYVFHGYDIQSFAVPGTPRSPFMLINDHNTFVYSVDLARGQHSQTLWVDNQQAIVSVAMNRRGNPIIVQDTPRTFTPWQKPTGMLIFSDQWLPMTFVDFASLNTTVTSWHTNKILIDTNDYTYIMGYNATGNLHRRHLRPPGHQARLVAAGHLPGPAGPIPLEHGLRQQHLPHADEWH